MYQLRECLHRLQPATTAFWRYMPLNSVCGRCNTRSAETRHSSVLEEHSGYALNASRRGANTIVEPLRRTMVMLTFSD
jgi:hypothetical protein